MTSTERGATASILPLTITVNGRTGLTLWAPPWEDEDGDEWQGFLGDGSKILLFPTTRELADFIASGTENDLSDHPAWGEVQKLTPDQLRPTAEDGVDLDKVYELAAGEPDPVHVSALANTVDMVAKIAECCDDGALRGLVVNTPAYAELVDEDVSFSGRDGRKRWNELGDTIAESWERAVTRVEGWLSWCGDFSTSEFAADSLWERVGAKPIRLVLPDRNYLTVRGETDEGQVLFLGHEGTIAVFIEVADLAEYCRDASEHDLTRLQWWEDVADAEDEEFEPVAEYDLRKPSTRGAVIVRELVEYCGLEADAEDLEDPIDKQSWRALVTEIGTCLERQD
jgi:hypothetical protein